MQRLCDLAILFSVVFSVLDIFRVGLGARGVVRFCVIRAPNRFPAIIVVVMVLLVWCLETTQEEKDCQLESPSRLGRRGVCPCESTLGQLVVVVGIQSAFSISIVVATVSSGVMPCIWWTVGIVSSLFRFIVVAC